MSDYKIGYSYNPATGEYIGTEPVYKEKATGAYPHANNVVFIAPPEPGENEWPIWTDTGWKLVPDHRGTPWYTPNGELGGLIERLGEVSEILKEPPEKPEHMTLTWDDKKKDWDFKPESGYIAEGETIREMTQAERIEAGLDPMPDDAHIVDGELVFYSQEELLELGKITTEQYNEYIREKREWEYRRTTDKIGLMVLRGEATRKEWQAAIQAVKEKYPYKE